MYEIIFNILSHERFLPLPFYPAIKLPQCEEFFSPYIVLPTDDRDVTIQQLMNVPVKLM